MSRAIAGIDSKVMKRVLGGVNQHNVATAQHILKGV